MVRRPPRSTLFSYTTSSDLTCVSVDDVEEIFETSVINDSVVERLVSTEGTWRKLQEIRQHNL